MRRRFFLFTAVWTLLATCDAGVFAEAPAVDSSRPLFTFGLVADVQYADKPAHGPRTYRDSIERLRQCVDALNAHPVDFTIQLGDLVDGYVQRDKTQTNDDVQRTRRDLDQVLAGFARLDKKLHHVVGNHCLRAGREELHKRLGVTSAFHDFTPEGVKGWRIVVLDGNGGGYGKLDKAQTQWLQDTLAKAKQDHERVILFNHFPLFKQAAPRHRMVSPKPIDRFLDQSGRVVAYFAGHDHIGGYALVRGVHHVTLHGEVESGRENAYAVVEVFPDRLEVHGFGKEPSRTLAFKNSEAAPSPSRAKRPAASATSG